MGVIINLLLNRMVYSSTVDSVGTLFYYCKIPTMENALKDDRIFLNRDNLESLMAKIKG